MLIDILYTMQANFEEKASLFDLDFLTWVDECEMLYIFHEKRFFPFPLSALVEKTPLVSLNRESLGCLPFLRLRGS